MNHVILVGSIPEAPRTFGEGDKYCSIIVETVKPARTLDDGRTMEEKRARSRVVCFGRSAASAKQLTVGDIVEVQGELQYYPIMTADGSAAFRTDITAISVSKVYY